MSETLVEDDSAYPTSVTVPEDGDARNAASVVVGFQALANRLAHFWTKFANHLTTGAGSLVVPSPRVDFDTTYGDVRISGTTGTKGLQFAGLAGLYPSGKCYSHLFTAGEPGEANFKLATPVSGAGPYTIDPSLYNVFDFTPSGTIVVNISTTPAYSYVEGQKVRIINRATSNGYVINIKRDAGAVTVYSLHIALATGCAFVDIVYRAGAWYEIGSNRIV